MGEQQVFQFDTGQGQIQENLQQAAVCKPGLGAVSML